MKNAIIGYGEIGRSIHEVYKQNNPDIQIAICDLDYQDNLENCDFFHICIPFNTKYSYIEAVVNYIKKYSPNYVIIHSTVEVGTTQEIANQTTSLVCHSPIRGLHPNLKEGILTFPIFVGTSSNYLFLQVEDLYKQLKINPIIKCESSQTTELAKLLDTTYYGVCIAFHKEAKELCLKYNLDFDEVMTNFNTTYNEGYTKLGKSNVVRPVLKDMPGCIGGHCVVPNAKLLSNTWSSPVLDLILKYQ